MISKNPPNSRSRLLHGPKTAALAPALRSEAESSAAPDAAACAVTAACRRTPATMLKLTKLVPCFANCLQARSRLYQNEFLQENMRLAAFFKLYKICTLSHHSNLDISAKNRFKTSAIHFS